MEDKLKSLGKNKEIKPFPISDKELCDRYEDLFGGAINDVLREMGYLYQTLPPSIAPLTDDMKLAGIAFTVKGSKDLTLENEMEFRAQMLEAIEPESISIWDTCGDDESAQWGEVMTMASQLRGCRGAVVDGGVRDTDKVLGLNFPVFCKYKTSNGMLGRFRIHTYQKPILIGKVTIYPGDIIFGDIDGIVIVPREVAYEVLVRSEEVKRNERQIKEWVLSGMLPSEVVKRGGYF
ncbi:RraA family protein [Cellulosilyticum sp. I15G10I2]|uniref:RraA family protein n=1 Tax=Cellulosilyticum sp. I15G10I2 TaxID=1892843 RepID=UPI00085C36D4|nr:RraA family protein [Cellulosilyticum sp. I15G10I2]